MTRVPPTERFQMPKEKEEEVQESQSSDLSEAEIQEAIRKHSRAGRPERGAKLRYLWESNLPIPYDLLDFTGTRAEKEVQGKLEVPPRVGPGSGKKAWIEFGAKVSDLDEAVLDKMNRDEIIEILETRGIIPTIEPVESTQDQDKDKE